MIIRNLLYSPELAYTVVINLKPEVLLSENYNFFLSVLLITCREKILKMTGGLNEPLCHQFSNIFMKVDLTQLSTTTISASALLNIMHKFLIIICYKLHV